MTDSPSIFARGFRPVVIAWVLTAAGGVHGAEPETPPTHWAWTPVHAAPLPRVAQPGWVRTPIDAFILAQLEARGMRPAPDAGRHALIRRVCYDLTGLPPTYEEVKAFEADPSPDAYERLVDRLLSSPAYGERWGRHWLDVARYANTVGDAHGRDPIAPYNYTYRDYVIGAFNADLPFDRFVTEQIAADRLDFAGDPRPLAALGFITVGRRFLGNIHDTLDDRIDVVTRGLMGLTVQCARCHDHKYDPITTRDYYALYGVFASTDEPEPPLIGDGDDPAAYEAYLQERKRREAAVETFRLDQHRHSLEEHRKRSGEYLLAAWETREIADPALKLRLIQERGLRPLGVERWKATLDRQGLDRDPVFGPWVNLASLPSEEFPAGLQRWAERLAGPAGLGYEINPHLARALTAPGLPASIQQLAERYGKAFLDAELEWQKFNAPVPNGARPDAGLEALWPVLYDEDGPGHLPTALLDQLITGTLQVQFVQIKAQIDLLEASHPGAPPRAVALADSAAPQDAHVFIRGNPRDPGPAVPRRFPGLLGGRDDQPFQHGSGRLELAQAVVNPLNPLTARVFVNRVWMHHFGSPLVATPDDFGTRSDPPSHPELLDWLADRFVRDGWSIKKLHRLIVLSNTYRQASLGRDHGDPDNHLLSKMNRRRLEFEAMRDTILLAAGVLDRSFGGKPVDLTQPPHAQRRAVYGFIDRQNLPSLLRSFDFADPDACTGRRYNTLVPQQGLFFMNDPFILDMAALLAQRLDAEGRALEPERIQALYRWVFQRDPTPVEAELGRAFVARASAPGASPGVGPWERYAQVLLQSNELAYLD